MSENKILQDAFTKSYASKSEIREMIRNYKNEVDEDKKIIIRDEIFLNSIRHIKKISLKFNKMYEDPEDCFQNGVLGFFDALERFELDKDTAFSTYLFYWVYKYIFEGCQKSVVAIPRNVQFMNYSYIKYKEIMESGAIKSHVDYLANKLFSNEVFKTKYIENELVNTDIKVISLDYAHSDKNGKENQNGELRLVNIIRDNQPSPEQIVIEKVNKEQLITIINTKLTDRERDIIILRYFSDAENLMTLKDIVEIMGTSSERIRQVEEKALWKLKRVFVKMKRENCF